MNPILVIGYGNPLRGDDGVGWRVAEEAAALLPDPPVTVLTVQLLTPELADPISRSDLLILIDAAAEGPPTPGLEGAVEVRPQLPVWLALLLLVLLLALCGLLASLASSLPGLSQLLG